MAGQSGIACPSPATIGKEAYGKNHFQEVILIVCPIVEDAVEECIKFIKDPEIPVQFISKVRKFMNSKQGRFEEFQLHLRYRLETLEIHYHELPAYVQMMCLAYENYQGNCTKKHDIVLPAPYDMEGIMKFLETRCVSKREQERYLQEFLELQMENYTHLIPKKKMQKALYKIQG